MLFMHYFWFFLHMYDGEIFLLHRVRCHLVTYLTKNWERNRSLLSASMESAFLYLVWTTQFKQWLLKPFGCYSEACARLYPQQAFIGHEEQVRGNSWLLEPLSFGGSQLSSVRLMLLWKTGHAGWGVTGTLLSSQCVHEATRMWAPVSSHLTVDWWCVHAGWVQRQHLRAQLSHNVS